MRYRVRFLVTARDDREAIKAYLNQFSTIAAKRLFGRIKNNLELVRENPYMYGAYERCPQFRRMVVEDYLLFYKVREDEKMIEVNHILHGMMDVEKFFGEASRA